MPGEARGTGAPSWRRAWLVPLLTTVGRRFVIYLALYPLHLAISGVALAVIALRAGSGDTDWAFWLCYSWIALQVVFAPRLFVPTALALAFVALQATQGDRDVIFWLCFSWLALGVLRGGIAIRAVRAHRRRRREQARAEEDPGFEAVFGEWFGFGGASNARGPAAGETVSDGPDGEPLGAETIEGTAREVRTDLVDELERLAALHEQGAIDDEEYEAAKRALLGTD